MQTASKSLTTPFGLPALFASARRSTGFFAHTTPGYDEPRLYRKAAAVVSSVRLADAFPVPSTDQARSLDLHSTQRSAGTTQTMSHTIMAASRVIRAGARLIPIDTSAAPIPNTSEVAWNKRPLTLKW